MFRKKNKQDLCIRFRGWVSNNNNHSYIVSDDSPIYWILTEKQKLCGKSVGNSEHVFLKNEIDYDTLDQYLAEYYHMREEQFKRDNERIRGENEKLVRKLAGENEELQRVKKELQIIREELDLTKREKWKQLFEAVLREVVIGKRYQQDVEQMRRAYEKEMENRRGFLARVLGK